MVGSHLKNPHDSFPIPLYCCPVKFFKLQIIYRYTVCRTGISAMRLIHKNDTDNQAIEYVYRTLIIALPILHVDLRVGTRDVR